MKVEKTDRRGLVVAALAVLLILVSAAVSYADSASLSIPVKHRFKGREYSGRDTFSFTLTAESEGSPMPEGSSGLSKTVSIKAGEKPDFGEITFTKPGIYYYVVSRQRENHTRIREDDSRYRVMVTVLSDMDTEVAITRIGGSSAKDASDQEDSGKVEEIIYTDIYDATPKTGDSAEVLVLVFTGIVCSAILFLMIASRRKEDADDKRI